MDRVAAIALLESVHTFPGDHTFRAIVAPHAAEGVLATVTAQWGEPVRVERVESRGGRWVSLRITLTCTSAAEALDVYAQLRTLPEIVQLV